VAAVPRWEPETVEYVAWEPETVNRKDLQVTKLHHPLKTGGRGFERAVPSFRNALGKQNRC
jgi:hypothetical protein